MRQRFGMGYDSHLFVEGRRLVLAGVEIPHTKGLKGHSDGDAVAHALIDALLGAAAMGDIGTHYPDTDARWRDADSMRLLRDVQRRIVAAGYSIVNVDVTVILEQPKLAPHVREMREHLARALVIAPGAVSVKAKTNEKMDSVGRGKGIQVFAIASLGGA